MAVVGSDILGGLVLSFQRMQQFLWRVTYSAGSRPNRFISWKRTRRAHWIGYQPRSDLKALGMEILLGGNLNHINPLFPIYKNQQWPAIWSSYPIYLSLPLLHKQLFSCSSYSNFFKPAKIYLDKKLLATSCKYNNIIPLYSIYTDSCFHLHISLLIFSPIYHLYINICPSYSLL
jgi:hypothetical protein